MALLDEEQLIIRWLTQYGPMTKGMIGKLLHYKSSDTVGRILIGLKRRNYITMTADHSCFATDRFSQIDPKMHEALLVLFQFVEQIDPNTHYAADLPAQIFFLKENTGYEIVVLHSEEDHLLKLLQHREGMKYIFVIPNLEFAYLLQLPDAPCLFAIIEDSDRDIPPVTFYSD